jgi:hypothetical protein
MTFSRNGMLVFTPRMRNSRSAAVHAVAGDVVVWPLAMTFTSIES